MKDNKKELNSDRILKPHLLKPRQTTKELMEAIGLSRSSVQRSLDRFVASGYAHVVGEEGNTRYYEAVELGGKTHTVKNGNRTPEEPKCNRFKKEGKRMVLGVWI